MLQQQFPSLILASKSPRRKDLLNQLGFTFEIVLQDVEENFPDELDKKEVPSFLAKKKATAIQDHLKDNQTVIVASDTIVLMDDTIYHKPTDAADAFRILSELSGKSHEVITGVCLMSKEKCITFSDTATVFLSALTPEEIHFYIDNYQPFDKAGAYAIQEWIGLAKVQKIEGTYNTIVGLPTQKLYQTLVDEFC
jgi:septum formation protein